MMSIIVSFDKTEEVFLNKIITIIISYDVPIFQFILHIRIRHVCVSDSLRYLIDTLRYFI